MSDFKEYVKCSGDPIFFIENYIKIIDYEQDLLIPFKLYECQKDIVHSFLNNERTIIASARQVGVTATLCALSLWDAIFNDNRAIAIVTNRASSANERIEIIKRMYDNLPEWMRGKLVVDNRSEIRFDNNSVILASHALGLKSRSINFLVVDDAAFVENWDEFYQGILPVVASSVQNKIILASCPNHSNHFHKLFIYAEAGLNGYNPIKINWYQRHGREGEWVTNTYKLIPTRFSQEYEVSFA